MILLTSLLLIWASSKTGIVHCSSCFTELSVGTLATELSNEEWNDLGKGFLQIFLPKKLSSEHIEKIRELKNDPSYASAKALVFSFSGLVFLFVVGIIMIILYSACPAFLCIFKCTCKKMLPAKTNFFISCAGLALVSLAVITFLLSSLFALLSINSMTNGIATFGTALEPLSGNMEAFSQGLRKQVSCAAHAMVPIIEKQINSIPEKISTAIDSEPTVEAVMQIDFENMKTKIKEFENKASSIADQLRNAEAPLEQYRAQGLAVLLTPVDRAIVELDNLANQLSQTGANSITDKINEVSAVRDKAKKEKIKETVKVEIDKAVPELKNMARTVDDGVESIFKSIDEKAVAVLRSQIDGIKEGSEKTKAYTSYAPLLTFLLFPTWIGMVSAIMACSKISKFMQKKKAKSKPEMSYFTPLVAGCSTAFLPLIIAMIFALIAGVANVSCASFFYDPTFEIAEHIVNELEVNTTQSFIIGEDSISVDIFDSIKKCNDRSPLITAFGLDSLLTDDLIEKRIDLDAKKVEMEASIDSLSFGIPSADQYNGVEIEVNGMESKRTMANNKVADAKNAINSVIAIAQQIGVKDKIDRLKSVLGEVETLMGDVKSFEASVKADIGKAKNLEESTIKASIKPKLGALIDEMMTEMKKEYEKIRTELLEKSTSCDFLFELVRSIGDVVCEQSLGGLNGIYAAFGLGVMTMISATIGVILVFISLNAGKQKKEAKSGDEKKDKPKEDKKDKGKKKGSEQKEKDDNNNDEPGDVQTPETPTPIEGTPSAPKSQDKPTPPPSNPAPPAAKTEPLVTAEDKTNPSLLPVEPPADPNSAPKQDLGVPQPPVAMVPATPDGQAAPMVVPTMEMVNMAPPGAAAAAPAAPEAAAPDPAGDYSGPKSQTGP